jgi:hypothetical protein
VKVELNQLLRRERVHFVCTPFCKVRPEPLG